MSFVPPSGDLLTDNSFETGVGWTLNEDAERVTTAARTESYSIQITGHDDSNLIRSPGFEGNTSGNWVYTTLANRSQVEVYDGLYSSEIGGSRAFPDAAIQSDVRQESISIVDGENYILDFYANEDSASLINLRVAFDTGDGSGFVVNSILTVGTLSGWTHIYDPTFLTLGAGGTSGGVRFRTGTSTTSVYSDKW